MSLSGGIAVMCYITVKLVFGRRFCAGFYKRLLLIVMLFFLIPFPEVKYQYADLAGFLFPAERWGGGIFSPQVRIGVPVRYVAYHAEAGLFYIAGWGWYIFTAACFASMAGMMMRQVYKDRKFKKEVCCSAEPENGELMSACKKWKNRLHITSTVEVKEWRGIRSPITVGWLKPVIVFPKAEEGEEEERREDLELMLLHELIHVKKQDVFLTMLCMAIGVLHFYNPFVYYLFREWCRVREMVCDEKVLAYAGEEKKKRYGDLIIESAVKGIFIGGFQIGFSQNGLMKERIKNIMKKRSNKWYTKLMAAGIGVGMVFLSSLTVFAYQPDVWIEEESVNFEAKTTTMYIDEKEYENQQKILVEVELDGKTVPFDFLGNEQEIIYLDEEGNAVIKEYQEQAETARILCNHTYTNGYLRNHIAYKDGSCMVKIYKAEYCTKCGTVKSQVLDSSTTYVTCPH